MNNVDTLALIASETIDLTNLRTTPTTNINFMNSSGNPVAYFDDSRDFTTYGILNNSGGVSFTNGLTVSAGASISYDTSHMLEMTATGTNITGDCNITGALSLNSLSIGSDIGFTNATQTNIICKKSLVLGQTGDLLGSSYVILQNRDGINGALFKTTDTLNYIVDFVFVDV